MACAARLLFGLAHVLDARGDYAAAADCLRRANALALELRRKQGQHLRPGEHMPASSIGSSLASRRTSSAGWPARATTTRRPVFVFGLPRSGTTLVEQVLASHSRVHGAGELRLARQSFEADPAPCWAVPTTLAACLNALDGGGRAAS